MVLYLPSTGTAIIQVLSAEVGTTLSINAPAEVIQGQSFDVFGVLQRVDTGEALAGEEIEFWQDGLFISSTLTASDGSYLFTHSIIDTGPSTLVVRFTGSERPGLILGKSQASTGVRLAVLEPVWIAASVALGVTLAMLGYSK